MAEGPGGVVGGAGGGEVGSDEFVVAGGDVVEAEGAVAGDWRKEEIVRRAAIFMVSSACA